MACSWVGAGTPGRDSHLGPTSHRRPTIHLQSSSLIEFDESQFPLVSVRVTGTLTEDEFQSLLDGLDRIRDAATQRYVVMFDFREMRVPSGRQVRVSADRIRDAATQRYVVMFDFREMRVPSGRQVRVSADWLRSRAAEIRKTTIANAFVVNSPSQRVTLTALFRLQASVLPYAIVETTEEARQVLQRYLDREQTVA